jgi:hypothetical protein
MEKISSGNAFEFLCSLSMLVLKIPRTFVLCRRRPVPANDGVSIPPIITEDSQRTCAVIELNDTRNVSKCFLSAKWPWFHEYWHEARSRIT